MESKLVMSLLVVTTHILCARGQPAGGGELGGLFFFMPEPEAQEAEPIFSEALPEPFLEGWYDDATDIFTVLDPSDHAISKRSLLPSLRQHRRLFSAQAKRSLRSSATFTEEDSHENKKRALSIFMAMPGMEETVPEPPAKFSSSSSRSPKLRPYGMPLRWG
ncbi:uncharacterized protein LOC108668915 [Hyalella azteca]|uniref:Uncharacterized protein LOC108668915 n=1 Tax=Hyalella azteca TaxID=294128 RepID=A0A8B7NDI6_HYAAZ|nr:uncharacterized protein LOC108668915 [Hyalella azteca]